MIPQSLRIWFIIHFVVDVIFAVPLLASPEWFAQLIAWPDIDPFTARLAGAALLAIGVESWLGRNAGPESYRALLNLKMIWAWAATAGIVATMLFTPGLPPIGWGFAAVFAGFGLVWSYYRWRVSL